MSEIYCVWCHDVICELPYEVWPPHYQGKRIFLNERKWDQTLFHTIFDHHGKKLVTVHYHCKEKYYRGTFRNGHIIPDGLWDYRCPTCNDPFDKRNFYVSKQLQVIHCGCVALDCNCCHKVIGRLPATRIGPYYCLHNLCAAKFCSKPLDYATSPYSLVADIDTFWPDKLTRTTAYLYPPEFRVTIRSLLLAVNRLPLPYRVPTDIILMIMNFAVSPMSYRTQHGFELCHLPTLLGGPCLKCSRPQALTRFDKGYCTPGDCLIFDDKKCMRGHFIKLHVSSPGDCTEYRCGSNNICRVCKGFIRYTSMKPINWCQVNKCSVKWDDNCSCGRSCFKHLDSVGQPIKLDADQCFIGTCRYIIADTRCKCGEALYMTSPSPYVCTADDCKMVDDAMRFIGETRAKGHLFSHGT